MQVFGSLIFLILIAEAYMALKRPYEVIFISWKATGSIQSRLRILGREHKVNGSVIFTEDLGDDRFTFGVDSYLDSFGSGDYKLLPFSISQGKACKTLKSNWKLFVPTLNFGVNTNFPINNITSPIRKGEYYVKDALVNPENWPLILPRGFIKVHLYFHKDNKYDGAHDVELQIVDRSS